MNDTHDTADGALPEVFLGRQPILDRAQQLVAYELLFRPSLRNDANPLGDQALATATVVTNAFTQLSLGDALGACRGYVNVDENFLFSELVEALPRESVVLEILESVQPTPEVLERCAQLKQAGFLLAVDDLVDDRPETRALLEQVDIIKIDVQETRDEALARLVDALRPLGKTLVAEKVETRAQMEHCHTLGFDLFQGYFFAQPTVIAGKRLTASEIVLLRLLGLVIEDADTTRIEQEFKQEPGLTLNLLRLTNSAASGLSTHITSLRHAITLLGRRQLQRWLQLLLYTAPQGGETVSPLLQLAATRGRLMELLAEKLQPQGRELADHAFMIGIMSLMPALLGMAMADLLAQLPVAPRVRQALCEYGGTLGSLLRLVESTEQADPAPADEALRALPVLNAQTLASCLATALAWSNRLGRSNG